MTVASPTETITVTAQRPAPEKSHFWAGSEFGFRDIIATINPLQHIPIVGMIYRSITGDTIGNVARVAGDGIYGGLLGLASGLVDVASIELTGKDVGQHVIDTLEEIGDELSPAKTPAPAAPVPTAPSPLVAAADQIKDPPKLPLFGSATTAGELAAAAPISPLLVPKLAARAQAAAQPASPAPGAVRPFSGAAQGIPIDVSDRGIASMRATSAAHSPLPVPLNLPAGAFTAAAAASSATPAAMAAAAQPDFTLRMREGLAKYDALMAARARDGSASTVDQLH
jgi:hypothetical protein